MLDGGPARDILDSSAAGLTIAHHAKNPDFLRGEEAAIRLALDAMATVARQDQARKW